MLTHPTIEKLHALQLTGMARAWEAQRHVPDIDTLSFEEHLGLLLDAESTIDEMSNGASAQPPDT